MVQWKDTGRGCEKLTHRHWHCRTPTSSYIDSESLKIALHHPPGLWSHPFCQPSRYFQHCKTNSRDRLLPEGVSQSLCPMSERFPRGCRFVEPQGLHLASIHVSPLFLKPRAVAGTLTPSGPDSFPPDFAPCWKALHPAPRHLRELLSQTPWFFSPEA